MWRCVEARVRKKLSQELSRTESFNLGELFRQDHILLNPQAGVHSGPVPETSRYSNAENQGEKEDRCHNDPHSEVGVSLNQSSQLFTSFRDVLQHHETFFDEVQTMLPRLEQRYWKQIAYAMMVMINRKE